MTNHDKLREQQYRLTISKDFKTYMEECIEKEDYKYVANRLMELLKPASPDTLAEKIERLGDKFEWLGLYPASPYGYTEDKYIGKNKWVCGIWEGDIAGEGEYFTEMSDGLSPSEALDNLYKEIIK